MDRRGDNINRLMRSLPNYLVWILILLAIVCTVLAATISNFLGETNPINLTFQLGGGNNTEYISIPLYAYIKNFTMTLDSPQLNTTYLCYQEYANQTASCPQAITYGNGTYYYYDSWVDAQNLFDGNFSSYGVHGDASDQFYINYTKPPRSYSATWYMRTEAGYLNWSINSSNWDIYSDRLKLWATSTDPGNYYVLGLTGLILLGSNPEGDFFYEEGVFWNISDYESLKNVRIEVGNTNSGYEFENLGELSSQVVAQVNVTAIRDVVSEGCICTDCIISSGSCQIPITFMANNSGNLIANITNIEYYTNLTVNIYDRETDALITNPVLVNVQGFGNFSTSTGTLIIENLTPTVDTWSVIASSSGYNTEVKAVELTDWASTTTSIYLANSTSTALGNLIVQVYDEFYNLITGANTKLLEFDAATNSFIQVSQCYTDTNGECIFDVELGTKFYIVQTSAVINGQLLEAQSTQNGQVIKLDNTIIELHLRTSERFTAPDYYSLQIAAYNTTLVGNTSYLTAIFNDGRNLNHSVCVGYFVRIRQTDNQVTETCINGSAGIVNKVGGYLLDRDYEYVAKIYTRDVGMSVYYQYVYSKIEGTLRTEWGFYLKPIILFMLLAILGVSLYLKNILIFSVGSSLISLLSVSIYPGLLGAVTVTIVIIINVCIFYMAKRKTEGIQ